MSNHLKQLSDAEIYVIVNHLVKEYGHDASKIGDRIGIDEEDAQLLLDKFNGDRELETLSLEDLYGGEQR